MLFLIVELDRLVVSGCSRYPLNRDFIVKGKDYKDATIKFLEDNPEIKAGEFLMLPERYAFTLDTNRIRRIRDGRGWKFPHVKAKQRRP